MADPASRYHLRKWYLDVLDDEGRGLIAYQADVTWGPLKLKYDGIIPIGPVPFKATSNFISHSVITETADTLQWKSNTAAGTWQRLSPAVDRVLLERPEGNVHWHCLQPSSSAAVTVSGYALAGKGYAERIELSLPPWQLPIRELLWGRFVSDRNAITWIKWIGPEPMQWVFRNGNTIEDCSVDADAIRVGNLRLKLPATVLRSGGIRDSVFRGFEEIASWFPRSILSLHEEKWYGRGELTEGASVIDEGNIIHEKVRWP